MPSSPKIQKETILETALAMLLRDGYAAINIKTVAKELGCSTQPISRQFGSMEGFRKELLSYCIGHMKTFFSTEGERASDIITGIAKGYVSLAFDCPNLYKYLYMSEHEEEKFGVLAVSMRSEQYERIIGMLQEEYRMPEGYAREYLNNLNFYVHGIASYAVVGYTELSKQEVMDRVQGVSEALLRNWKEMKVR